MLRKFVGVLAALSGLAATPVLADNTKVTFMLDFISLGRHAPWYVALDKGYFAEEGLEVTIDTGNGSVEAIPRVATGAYQFGFGDINSLIKFLDEDPSQPVKAIMMVYDKPTFSIIGRKSLGITDDPKSIEGKKLGAPPPDGAFAQWPAFVDAAGIDASAVTIESIGFPVREPMLAAGQVDAITGFSFSSFINLKEKGVAVDDITVLLMADYGVNLYGNAIIVNPKFAAEHPDAVKGFIRAADWMEDYKIVWKEE